MIRWDAAVRTWPRISPIHCCCFFCVASVNTLSYHPIYCGNIHGECPVWQWEVCVQRVLGPSEWIAGPWEVGLSVTITQMKSGNVRAVSFSLLCAERLIRSVSSCRTGFRELPDDIQTSFSSGLFTHLLTYNVVSHKQGCRDSNILTVDIPVKFHGSRWLCRKAKTN